MSLLTLTLFPFPLIAGNLVNNGDFEENKDARPAPDGWLFQTNPWSGAKGAIKWDDSVKYSGKYSVRIEQVNDQGYLTVAPAQPITVKPGVKYRFSGYIKTEFHGPAKAYFTINLPSQKGKEILATKLVRETSDWEKYKATFTATEEEITVLCAKTTGDGVVWFDKLDLREFNEDDPDGD